ncbi:hypothetical protein K438DRAFT_1831357 [Mycena galopus ATCC 62051]|nr:hypothetical protein K438DRAFT_1831357 [Mycena galopus ATCC 62051]
METNSSAPRLPAELECRIFEFAAVTRPTTIPILMLVTSRVKYWIEPLLYRVVVLSSSHRQKFYGFPVITASVLLRVIETKPPHFLQNAVKIFFFQRGPFQSTELDIEPSDLEIILPACTGVTTLFDDHVLESTATYAALAPLRHLRRLTLQLRHFLNCCSIDSTHSTLSNITHLELTHASQDLRSESVCASLPLMPNLTHFCISSIPHYLPLQTALCASTKIACVVFAVKVGEQSEQIQNTDWIVHDLRFVCLDRRNRWGWFQTQDKWTDFWALADAFIAARREGKVERSRYHLSDKETSFFG